ncbi:Hypothetical predicted protein, partial [Paramuricea clavata]
MADSRAESALSGFFALLLLSLFLQQVIHSRPYKDDRSHVLMGLGYDLEFIGGQSGVCYHNFVCIWSWRVKSKVTVNDCNHLCGCSISYYPNSTAKFRPVLLLKYDIEINPGPGTQNSTNILQHKLKFLSLNSRSIVNKANHLTALESVNEHDLIAIVETWLNPTINDAEILSPSDFCIHRRDRTDRRGGGVMLAVRKPLYSTRRTDLETDAEILACEVRPTQKKKILVLVFYRPPSTNHVYMNAFNKCLKNARVARFTQIVVLGDFNLPDMNWNTNSSTNNGTGQLYDNFTKAIRDNFLWQLVDQPTRKEHILDLVLTNIPHKISNLEIFDDTISTDHKLIEFYLDFNIPKRNKISKSVFNFKKAKWNELKIALTSASWDQVFVYDCVNATLSSWTKMFMEIVEKYVPKIEIRNSNSTPWIDQDVIRLLRKKDKQRRIANKSFDNEDSVFTATDNVCSNNDYANLDSHTSLTNITLSENEVLNRLQNINVSKASGPDGIPGRLLKAIATEITPSLTKVFNLSLCSGKVPSAWKTALITPILKEGNPHVVTNYRPISLLSILSKVLERCIYNHCYEFIQHKLTFYQHGFVQGRNCVTQLVRFYHKILEALGNGHEVDTIYLDFSKAFDRISHHPLLDKLKRHGFGGTLHDWFADYVTARSQKVVIDGDCSDLLSVTSG